MGAGKDLVRRALGKTTPGQHLNRLPGPRVLIERHREQWITRPGRQAGNEPVFDADDVAERLRRTVPTVVVVDYLPRVNLNEWDCLVTASPPVSIKSETQPRQYHDDQPVTLHSWKQRYPAHLSVVCFIGSGGLDVLDAFPGEAEEQSDLPNVAVVRDSDKVGLHLRQLDGLPDSLANVVKRDLVAVARQRSEHPSFRRWVGKGSEARHSDLLALTPFLLGPDDVVLAGSYERSDEASVWLLPDDLLDPYPWVVEALRDWHLRYPSRFPYLPDWHEDADWQTHQESQIAAQRDDLEVSFTAQFEAFQQQRKTLEGSAQDAFDRADLYERALLTQDGPALEGAVGQALADLGFHVVDMDEHWNDGDRREDLRVFDDQDPAWVAIVEVKGAKGGPKETEVQNFGRWAERFILDEHRAPSARWFVTNHQRHLSPSERMEPFGDKSAVLTTFAKSQGTVIDTRALFDLLKIVALDPTLKPAARRLLKSGTPVVTRVDSTDLVRHGGTDAEHRRTDGNTHE